jgi:hypothetical protein
VGDGTVSLVWEPAPVDGTPVTGYRLDWPGGSLQLSGDQTSVTVSGLDNYTIYDFALTARNIMGWSDQVSLTSGQPSGRPVCQGVLTIQPDDLADEARVNLSWSAADANGPGPVTYALRRSGQGEVGFGPLSGLRWTDQVAYDGTSYHYVLEASNATGGPDHTCTLERDFSAIGLPAAWGGASLTVVPTGQDGQAKLTLEVPPSRGAVSELTLVGWPGVSLTSPGPNGGRIEQLIDGLPNGVSTPIQVQLCNENRTPCQTSPTRNVTVFGQLATPQITAWPHGSYGDHLLCASATADGRGAEASLRLRTSDGALSDVVGGIGEMAISEWCVDAVTEETTLTFFAEMQSSPTTPGRPNPMSGMAQATTPKDPKPPLLAPTLTTRQGDVGDTEVCATGHGDGRGYPANLYISNSFTGARSATVSGNGTLNTSELCVDPGTPGAQVTFTAHLATGLTDPPRTDAPDGTVTLVSSALPLLSPDITAERHGDTPDYGVCARAQGNGRGTMARLYLTSSTGSQSDAVVGTGSLVTVTWCLLVEPSTTVTFTAHLEDASTDTPRPATTNTASATSAPPPPTFFQPTLNVWASGSTGNQEVCASASGDARGYTSTLTLSNNKNGSKITKQGSGSLSTGNLCVSAGFGATVTFTVVLHSEVAGRPDSSKSASITAPPDYSPSVSLRLSSASVGSCSDGLACYSLWVSSGGFPNGTLNCTLVNNNVGHGVRSWTQPANQANYNTGIWFGDVNTKAEVRCSLGSYSATSGFVNLPH